MPPRKKTRETLVNEPRETPTAVDGPQEAAVAAPKETPTSGPQETTGGAVAPAVPYVEAPPAFEDDGKQWPPPGCHCSAGIIHKNHPGRMPEPEQSV